MLSYHVDCMTLEMKFTQCKNVVYILMAVSGNSQLLDYCKMHKSVCLYNVFSCLYIQPAVLFIQSCLYRLKLMLDLKCHGLFACGP